MKKCDVLYLVIPCYNEEEVLPETTKRLEKKLEGLIKKKVISEKSKVMYVNDGSKDKTWELIKKINKDNSMFTGICLSRNRGHQNALVAGLLTAKEYADVVISMEKARDQAELFGHSLQREVGYLTAHSVLHLLGYDHMEKLERVRMREKEEAILTQLGLKRNSSYYLGEE